MIGKLNAITPGFSFKKKLAETAKNVHETPDMASILKEQVTKYCQSGTPYNDAIIMALTDAFKSKKPAEIIRGT